jgi:hypothetical protein
MPTALRLAFFVVSVFYPPQRQFSTIVNIEMFLGEWL